MGWKLPGNKRGLAGADKIDHRRGQNRTAQARHRQVETAERNADIAVLDFETDRFDNVALTVVRPFLAVLYSNQFPTIIIWDEDFTSFIDKLLEAINNLPRAFTIYAHNGGKFDYMFFVHKLRGEVMFKGRGIMSCRIGPHELRDSFHLIPERLAGYKKDDFDYSLLNKENRNKPANRKKIIDYCVSDCRYLLDIVSSFIAKFGRKLSIGQAAQAGIKDAGYKVSKMTEHFDAYMRHYYFGGRVECLAGIGHFVSKPGREYKLYDVNSMYPDAMVRYQHPIGAPDEFTIRPGKPGPFTFFIHLECENYGALVSRMEDGSTSAVKERGEFFTTIHEYNAALELGLIDNIKIKSCVDCVKSTTFERFIIPAYNNRLATKAELDRMKKAGLEDTPEYLDVKKDDIFWKLLQNNAYGKWAQNPRRFKEAYITDLNTRPPNDPERTFGDMPVFEDFEQGYAIWERPQKRLAFNNVTTAASITGAARATLMRGIALADDPIYCDTDSIICANLSGVKIDKTELGAWDIEDTYTDVIIAGKKLYACRLPSGKFKIRMKGSSGADWEDFKAFLANESRSYTMKGPTMTRTGRYQYMTREVRATGPKLPNTRLLTRKVKTHGE